MKSIFTLSIALCTSILMFGQSLELSQTQAYLDFNEFIDYQEIQLTNNSDATITVAVDVEKQCYNEADGSGVQLCWGKLCYPPTNDNYTVYDNVEALEVIEAGASTGMFSVHQFWIEETYGQVWRLYFYDVNNPEDRIHLDIFVGTCSPDDQVSVAAVEVQDAELVIAPNPATTVTEIFYNVPGAQVIIRDLTGRIAATYDDHNSQTTVQLDDFQSGIYLVSVLNGSQVIETKRLVVR